MMDNSDRQLIEDIVVGLSDEQVKRLMDKHGEDIWFKYGDYVTFTGIDTIGNMRQMLIYVLSVVKGGE